MRDAPVTLALLNYNGEDLVRRCVGTILKQTILPEKIVYIDNGSTNFDENAVRQIFTDKLASRLSIIRIEKNVGYVNGFNTGLKQLLEKSDCSPWIQTLSNDTELDPHFFENIVVEIALVKNSAVGMFAPKIRSMPDRQYLDGAGLSICLDGMSTARGQYEKDNGQYDKKTTVLCPSGVSAIYKSELLKEIGLMDESFESYCEDTDIGVRAWLAGWDCVFVPAAIVYHQRSSTIGMKNLRKLYLVERNHYWVAAKNFPLTLLLMNPFFTLWRLFIQAYSVLVQKGQGGVFGAELGVFNLIFTTLRAQIAAFFGLPLMLFKRLKQRRLVKRSRLEIFSWFLRRRLRFSELILKRALPASVEHQPSKTL